MTRTQTSMDWNELGGSAQYKEGLPVSQRCLDILNGNGIEYKLQQAEK